MYFFFFFSAKEKKYFFFHHLLSLITLYALVVHTRGEGVRVVARSFSSSSHAKEKK